MTEERATYITEQPESPKEKFILEMTRLLCHYQDDQLWFYEVREMIDTAASQAGVNLDTPGSSEKITFTDGSTLTISASGEKAEAVFSRCIETILAVIYGDD